MSKPSHSVFLSQHQGYEILGPTWPTEECSGDYTLVGLHAGHPLIN